ncbi:putative N-acetylated-alpha-linked acidic dipeptidase isoform X2 [Oculina patagonica]
MAEKAEFTAIKGDEDVALSPQEERKARRGRRKCIVVTVVVVIVLILVAFVAGYLVRRAVKPGCEEEKTDHDEHQDEDQDPESYHKEAIKGISKEHIEESLKYLTKAPHPSGSAFSNEQAQRIKKKWEESGFDKVELKKYDVLLSYPERPGIASIKSDNGTTLFTAQRKEKVLEPSENKPDVLPPFNAYSSSGNVTARLVYVNYGMVEDFKKLREMNISVKGHIVIAKYGKIYRGDKARIAADKGAIGLILYTDPIDYSPEGVDFTYPKSWWLPPSGVQRGTLLNLEEGDPLTPGYPARDDIYRMPQDKLNLPSIPVYPVSYEDAAHFLKLLTVNEAPKDWQGGLKMKYNITMAAGDKRNVSLDIKMKLEKTPIYNVIGTITGREEPDRLVLLGNHRDAWTFGAADASSGTAAMLEISKKLGEMKAKGWKPRRTMVLCSWGAEEHGMLGSTEWAEDFANLLSNRAVVYLNVDVAVKGNFTLRVQSSPLLEFAFMEATKKIQPPGSDNPDDTLYEDWKNKNPDKEDPNLPTITKVGSGSDHTTVYFRLGVPSVYFEFTYDKKKWSVSNYPVYHSLHDTFHWMKTFVDRDFEYHRTLTQLWLQIGLTLADQPLLPFNCSQYADRLTYYAKDIKTKYEEALTQQKISLDYFMSAVKNFSDAASTFNGWLNSVDQKNPLALRMANDRLMQIERAFINPQGLPGRPYMRHVVFAPSAHNAYAGSSFPGLVDALYSVQLLNVKDWELVKKELSVAAFYIQSATNVMLFESL